jgi:hypothetical protein
LRGVLGGDECIWPHELVTDFKIGHDLMRAGYQHKTILKNPEERPHEGKIR